MLKITFVNGQVKLERSQKSSHLFTVSKRSNVFTSVCKNSVHRGGSDWNAFLLEGFA